MAVVNMNPRLWVEQPRPESTELKRITLCIPDLIDLEDFLVKLFGKVVDVDFDRSCDFIGGPASRWQHGAGLWIKPQCSSENGPESI